MSFRPPLWASAAVAVGISAMIALGCWQLARGDQKKALIAQLLAAQVAPPAVVTHLDAAMPERVLHVKLRGTYDVAHQLLQDNQTLDQHPGYHVWTALHLDSGQVVVVDRGWVAQDPDRAVLPEVGAPAEAVEIDGLWRALPRAGLKLGDDAPCTRPGWPRLVQYPTLADLACTVGGPLADGLLLLSPEAGSGFVRRWQITPEMPPEKHYAYAMQWFAMALALLILFVKLNLKRTP